MDRYLGFTHRDHNGMGAAVDRALDHHRVRAHGADDGRGAGGGQRADGLVHFAVVDVAVFAVYHYGLWDSLVDQSTVFCAGNSWCLGKRRTSAPKPPTSRASEYPGNQSHKAMHAGPPSLARSRACRRRVLPVVETMEDLEASRWAKEGGAICGSDLRLCKRVVWRFAAGAIVILRGARVGKGEEGVQTLTCARASLASAGLAYVAWAKGLRRPDPFPRENQFGLVLEV